MKIAIMQPYLFPYIGYFQLMNAVDKFVVFDDVNFKKKGWINRNNILADGKEKMFTVPIVGSSQNKIIKELEISETENWRESILSTIKLSYRNASNFPEVFSLLEEIINADIINLADFIRNSLIKLARYLSLTVQIIDSSAVYNNTELKGQDRIIEICKRESACEYVNTIGGMDIYRREDFAREGIKIHFLKTRDIKYAQFNNEFIPGLSIIDILMFNRGERVQELLNNYKFI